MRKAFIASIAGVALAAAAASSASALTFAGDYNVSLYTGNNGLQVAYSPITSDVNGLNFALNEGQTLTLNLFNLYTNEGGVNWGEDTNPRPITVSFSFTLPTNFGGVIEGDTSGEFYGLWQQGEVHWDNGGTKTFNFGNGGQLRVDLDDTSFNGGWFGLEEGPRNGSTIAADFTLVSAGAVPEPATWAMMITGFGLAGATMRRRRAALSAA